MRTILAASTACEGSRLGTSSGKKVVCPECSSRWIRSNNLTHSRLGLLPRSCMDQRGAKCFMRKRRNTKLLDGAVYHCGNKTKKKSDESPTDQEHRLGDRPDQAKRVQLTLRGISFGCLIFGGGHCLRFYFLLCARKKDARKKDLLGCSSAKLHSKVLYSCYSNLLVM